MASSSTNPIPNYPYPLEVNVSDLVPDKLSKSNYSEWKLLMEDFIESRGMNEFIHYTDKDIDDFNDPKKDVKDSNDKKKEIEDPYFDDYNGGRSRRKSDGLVRAWILSTLNKDIVKQVLPHKTAKTVWMALVTKFGSRNAQQPDSSSYIESHRRLGDYMPLHINAIQGDIESAMRIIDNEPEAIRKPISTEGESMLITAVRSVRRNELVARLLGMLSAKDLADQRDYSGRTALHVAAEVGNLEAAKKLMDHNCDLLIIEDKEEQTPLIYAAKTANMEMVRFLLDRARARAEDRARAEAETETKAEAEAEDRARAKAWIEDKTPWPWDRTLVSVEFLVSAAADARAWAAAKAEVKAGAEAEARAKAERLGFSETGRGPPTLLYHLANSGLYDIALELLQQYSMLACTGTDTDTSTGSETCPLMAMSQKRSSFRSGTPLNSFQKFIYSIAPAKLRNNATKNPAVNENRQNPPAVTDTENPVVDENPQSGAVNPAVNENRQNPSAVTDTENSIVDENPESGDENPQSGAVNPVVNENQQNPLAVIVNENTQNAAVNDNPQNPPAVTDTENPQSGVVNPVVNENQQNPLAVTEKSIGNEDVQNAHTSSIGKAQQQTAHTSSIGTAQQQTAHTSSIGTAQQRTAHTSSIGMAQQQTAHTSSIGTAQQQTAHTSSIGMAQQQTAHTGSIGTAQQQTAHTSSIGTTQQQTAHQQHRDGAAANSTH